ncbi:amidohydrolase [Kordiimonas lacus]|uniref:Hippurate hydrolase n=1 Tax=Kordiimonas lacus TaxID=637679 RepID=A0A1G6YNG4_9PROT|nr:amidohydrolase [Kordiimonas lacus]SDD91207.1 hippurate hydrolase [Kordiimonas lacus]
MKHSFTKTIAALSLLASTSLGAAADNHSIKDAIAKDYDYLEDLFVYLHKNPELSFRENETAERLSKELSALGFDVTTGVGRTGLVAMMKNGDGPTLLIRADMDGLPVEEASGLPYASTKRQVNLDGVEMPVMHACGHDMHMTGLVGTARQLVAMKDKWQGTLLLVGQPAEETISGAKAMIEDGIYERFPRPDYAVALHVAAQAPAGMIVYKPGIMYSSSDSVRITVHGVGTHGASPHLGKDPIVIGSQIVNALQTLVAREISPLSPGVVTVGTFHAGTKNNIISDEAVLTLTVRSNDEEVRHKLLAGIKRVAENTGRVAGLPEDKLPTVELSIESTPTTVNDKALTSRLDNVLREHFPEGQVARYEQKNMGAEDFAYFSQVDPAVPGFYFIVGGTPMEAFEAEKNGGPAVAGHHSPLFKIAPEPSVKAGVEAMTVIALDLLGK